MVDFILNVGGMVTGFFIGTYVIIKIIDKGWLD